MNLKELSRAQHLIQKLKDLKFVRRNFDMFAPTVMAKWERPLVESWDQYDYLHIDDIQKHLTVKQWKVIAEPIARLMDERRQELEDEIKSLGVELKEGEV